MGQCMYGVRGEGREQRAEEMNRKNVTLNAERQEDMREREGAGNGKQRRHTQGKRE